MDIGKRYGWTGHNFPSEGWKKDSGSSVTWFRDIGGRTFQFTAWLDRHHRVTTVIAAEFSPFSSRHEFSRQGVCA